MKTKIFVACFAICVASATTNAKAAAVSFLGEIFPPGNVGGVIGSLPRNFKLNLTYTENPGGSPANFTGTFFLPSTPNANTTNPNPEPSVLGNTTGSISITNGVANDIITFGGVVPSPQFGNVDVNYNFTFTRAPDTVDNNFVTMDNVKALINGQATIEFTGGLALTASGVIQEAPEPSTMVALTCLVAVGSGVGLRRRRAAKKASEEDESVDS